MSEVGVVRHLYFVLDLSHVGSKYVFKMLHYSSTPALSLFRPENVTGSRWKDHPIR